MKGVLHSSKLRHNHGVLPDFPRAHILHSRSFCSSKRRVARDAAPLAQEQEQEQYTVRLESLGCPKNVVDGIFHISRAVQS